jgi:hypothetical protein
MISLPKVSRATGGPDSVGVFSFLAWAIKAIAHDIKHDYLDEAED